MLDLKELRFDTYFNTRGCISLRITHNPTGLFVKHEGHLLDSVVRSRDKERLIKELDGLVEAYKAAKSDPSRSEDEDAVSG